MEPKHAGLAGDAGPTHEPDSIVALHRDFIYLPADQLIGLKTSIPCPTIQRASIYLTASSSPYYIDADRIAQLPETRMASFYERVWKLSPSRSQFINSLETELMYILLRAGRRELYPINAAVARNAEERGGPSSTPTA